ncbi:uncharacterized protein B0H18DRAFT_1212404 [Fomitopsis serialis]|uniref:uncharacterized protein n=1 Tax=Fomitopsis serialis TaxID=139415 RepID=UPI0020082ACD|nr:uncharacterized protein B0H18DRAFT_1212404 [Neoantrodia serialis]KAH9922956.1 hypothetical protein B0H18DRAFT_1212404 [Neoantrodia serialis]
MLSHSRDSSQSTPSLTELSSSAGSGSSYCGLSPESQAFRRTVDGRLFDTAQLESDQALHEQAYKHLKIFHKQTTSFRGEEYDIPVWVKRANERREDSGFTISKLYPQTCFSYQLMKDVYAIHEFQPGTFFPLVRKTHVTFVDHSYKQTAGPSAQVGDRFKQAHATTEIPLPSWMNQELEDLLSKAWMAKAS